MSTKAAYVNKYGKQIADEYLKKRASLAGKASALKRWKKPRGVTVSKK